MSDGTHYHDKAVLRTSTNSTAKARTVKEGAMTDHTKTSAGLDKRQPQQSESARLDRVLRISGGLDEPHIAGCTDVTLMRRVLDNLRRL